MKKVFLFSILTFAMPAFFEIPLMKEAQANSRENLSKCHSSIDRFYEIKKDVPRVCLQDDLERCEKKYSCGESEEKATEVANEAEALEKTLSLCKEYSEEDLDELKDNKKEFTERRREIEEEIGEKQEKIVTKQGEMETLDAEAQEEALNLKHNFDKLQEGLASFRKEREAEIDQTLDVKIKSLQDQLSQSDKLEHGIANTITEIERTKRVALHGLIQKCNLESEEKIATYRQKRRSAITEGRYRVSVKKLMNKNRISLKSKDNSRLKKYYGTCWKKNKFFRDEIEKASAQKRKEVNQKQKEVFKAFKLLEKEIVNLNKEALGKKSSLITDHSKKTEQALKKFNEAREVKLKSHNTKKAQLQREITKLEEDKARLVTNLRDKKQVLIENKVFIHQMKGNKKKQKAWDKISELQVAHNKVVSSCQCDEAANQASFTSLQISQEATVTHPVTGTSHTQTVETGRPDGRASRICKELTGESEKYDELFDSSESWSSGSH